jgi:hypothetical protein
MALLKELGATATKILTAFETQLTTQGVDLPPTKYPAAGSQLVWDGPQFNILLMGLHRGQPAQPIQTTVHPYGLVWAAQWGLHIVRTVPVISGEGTLEASLPQEKELAKSGEETIGDAAALAEAAEAIHLASLEPHNPVSITGPNEGFAIGEVSPMSVAGGLVATRLVLTVSLS